MHGWLTKLLGNKGERLAARHLRKQGFRILARQYRSATRHLRIQGTARSNHEYI